MLSTWKIQRNTVFKHGKLNIRVLQGEKTHVRLSPERGSHREPHTEQALQALIPKQIPSLQLTQRALIPTQTQSLLLQRGQNVLLQAATQSHRNNLGLFLQHSFLRRLVTDRQTSHLQSTAWRCANLLVEKDEELNSSTSPIHQSEGFTVNVVRTAL